jgi:hypothetical protein
MVEAIRKTLSHLFGAHPYAETLEQIDKLAELDRGWNGYRAGRITDEARQRAKGLVEMLVNLPTRVPPPSVAPTPNGGVRLQWITPRKVVEIIFVAGGGEYSVSERGADDVLDAGSIHAIDPLKDLVRDHVVAHTR